MISGKPQAHTRAEGGDGGGPKAEAHAKRDRAQSSTDSSREVPQKARRSHSHTRDADLCGEGTNKSRSWELTKAAGTQPPTSYTRKAKSEASERREETRAR